MKYFAIHTFLYRGEGGIIYIYIPFSPFSAL